MQPKLQRYAVALGLDLNGHVTRNLQDPTGGAYSEITHIVEHDGKLYFGSLTESSVGVVQPPPK